jgi:hypothetical protein
MAMDESPPNEHESRGKIADLDPLGGEDVSIAFLQFFQASLTIGTSKSRQHPPDSSKSFIL